MWIDYSANQVLYLLRRIPLIGKKVPSDLKQKKHTAKICTAVYIAAGLLWEIVKKLAFGAVFLVLPRYLFCKWMAVGEAGFGLDDSFVYFTLILNCFGGSLLHSFVFQVDEQSVAFLKGMKVRPKSYFRFGLLQKLVREAIAFWLMDTIFGMHPLKAVYLTLLVLVARFVGETFHILVFRITKKRFSDLKGSGSILMAVSLFAAYFIPYIRGCVPAIYNMIFSTIWFAVMLAVAAFFIYFVWNCEDYTLIANRIHTIRYLELREETTESYEAVRPAEENLPDGAVSKLHGLHYLERLFLIRNRRMLLRDIFIRAGFIMIALCVAVIAISMGHGDIVYRVMEVSLPVLVIVMYILSDSYNIGKARFWQSDRYLLHYGYYRFQGNLIRQFTIRLKDTILLNLIPAVILVFAYAAAGIAADVKGSFVCILLTCIGIILLSIFFSIFHMLVYYLFQPYDMEGRHRNPVYIGLHILMLAGCYFCIYIETTPLIFVLGIAAATMVLLGLSGTLVWYFGEKQFRVYKN